MAKINPYELLEKHYVNNEFFRYDVFVRYMFIEEYYKEGKPSDFSFTPYSTLLRARNKPDKTKDFINLINSFENYGYKKEYPIIVDDRSFICGGSHRLATAMWFGQDVYTEHVSNMNGYPSHKRMFDKMWFVMTQITNTLLLAENKRKDLYKEKEKYFYAILQPPISNHYDEIEKEINNNFNILHSENVKFDIAWKEFIHKVYEPDSMQSWKLDKKVEILKNYPKEVRVLYIDIKNPQYVSKKGGVICAQAKYLKEVVRNQFWPKVEEYKNTGRVKPDLIIHMGDTWEHTNYIKDYVDGVKIV